MSLYDINTDLKSLHDWLEQDVRQLLELRNTMDHILDIPIDTASESDNADIRGYFNTTVRRIDIVSERIEGLRTALSEIYINIPNLKQCIDNGYVEIYTGGYSGNDGDDDEENEERDEDDYDRNEDDYQEWEP